MSILRRFTDFILQNRLQTMAIAFVCAYIPIIGSISVLIAGLVTLRKGAFEGGLVILAATFPYLFSYYTLPFTDENGVALIVISVMIISNFLTWLFAVVLRKYSSWSFVLDVCVLLSIGIIGAAHIFFPDIQQWWSKELTMYFSKMMAMANDISVTSGNSVEEVQKVIVIKKYATGFVVIMVLLNALLQLSVARWWQAIMFNPGGLRQELCQIRLSYLTGALFIVGFTLSYSGNLTALDMMPVFYLIFCAAGFSLVHGLFTVVRMGWLGVLLVYLAVIWLFPVSIVILAVIALLDIGMDFRRRAITKR